MEPSYIKLYNDGTLGKISDTLFSHIIKCGICPRRCGIDRRSSKIGICRSGLLPMLSSYNSHFGEESCLVGFNGSGTIFFTNCNLSCIFCQNYDISHLGRGDEISNETLADIMLALQSKGCHNINFVTPTHMIYPIIKALLIAVPRGLKIPLIYNTGGYDSINTLKMIKGIFDIYMPDLKYMDPETAFKLSGAEDYPVIATEAIKEMHQQVGDLLLDKNGIAGKGLLVRHLVLPNNLAATDRVIAFISGLSKNTYINIMNQYRPEFRARENFDLKRRITLDEYDMAVELALQSGLKRIDNGKKIRC